MRCILIIVAVAFSGLGCSEADFASSQSARSVAPGSVAPTLSPIVTDMPRSAETSIESVATYIRDHESDPYRRVKALHDWVADRIAYVDDGGEMSAEAVFNRRSGVCEGYAKLLAALGVFTGDHIAVVIGDAIDEDGTSMGILPRSIDAARTMRQVVR
jgi:hypothetical protein